MSLNEESMTPTPVQFDEIEPPYTISVPGLLKIHERLNFINGITYGPSLAASVYTTNERCAGILPNSAVSRGPRVIDIPERNVVVRLGSDEIDSIFDETELTISTEKVEETHTIENDEYHVLFPSVSISKIPAEVESIKNILEQTIETGSVTTILNTDGLKSYDNSSESITGSKLNFQTDKISPDGSYVTIPNSYTSEIETLYDSISELSNEIETLANELLYSAASISNDVYTHEALLPSELDIEDQSEFIQSTLRSIRSKIFLCQKKIKLVLQYAQLESETELPDIGTKSSSVVRIVEYPSND